MAGYTKVNLSDMIDVLGEERVKDIIKDYQCPLNKDVEEFLLYKAIEFAKQNIAITHLIYASYKDEQVLVGYFTLAQKYFHINTKKKGTVGSNLRRRISKFATYDDDLKTNIVSSPLIGQLGKNYNNGYNKLITGDELLKLACDTVASVQRIVGGKLVYLECEDIPSLVQFYEENGFHNFGRRELDLDEMDKFSSKYLIQMLKYL